VLIEKRYRQVDVPRLCEINEICFSGEERPPEQTFRDILLTSDVWVARMYTGVLGFAVVKPDSIPYLWMLAVLPAHRDMKVGTDILKDVEGYYLSKDYAEMTLHVHSGNWRAQRFYLSHGYRVSKIEEDWYTDGLGVKMVKKL
jgi:ribosomal protein S18 acetylase RimI-like enzyme